MSLFFDLVIPTAALAGLAAIFIVLFYYCRRRFLVYQESSQYQINQLQRKTLDFGITYKDIKFSKLLGKGSQGEVYLGQWRGLQVAVKKIDTSVVAPEIVEEFCQEADIMRRLRHPCLTLFMGVSLEAPHLCIVTELVDRGSLFDIMHEESGLTWRKGLSIAMDVASGMTYLHGHNPPILHRDLKSLNILITKTWKAKVSDFGMSRLAESEDGTMTQCGSPLWMSPYTHEIPYRTLNYSPSQLVVKVVKENLRPEIPKGMPKAYQQLMQKCWAPHADQRPSFKQILSALEEMNNNPIIVDHKPKRRKDDDEEESEEEGEEEEEENVDAENMVQDVTSYEVKDMEELEIFPSRINGPATEQGEARDLFQRAQANCLVYKGKYRGKHIIVKKFACNGLSPLSSPTNPTSPISRSDLTTLDAAPVWRMMKRYAELRHPNLVLFMGAYVDYDHVGVVEEEVARGSLSRLLRSSSCPTSWEFNLQLLLDTAQALQYLHAENLIHPQLNTSQLLVTTNWRVKVRDYLFVDLSRALAKQTEYIDEYTAPELYPVNTPTSNTPLSSSARVYCISAPTPAANVYSFAIVIWELLSRKFPFEHKFSPKIFGKLREGFRLPIPSSISSKFRNLIKQCWHSNIEKRPSFREIVEILKEIKSEGPPRMKLDLTNAKRYRKSKTVYAYKSKDPMTVLKDWGRNKGKPGSMVIASENDDLYMCDIEVFESTYESTGRPGEYRKIGTILATRMPEAFAIKTESGSIEQGNAGDYLVQNDQLDQWTCDGKVFEGMYESIEEVKPTITVQRTPEGDDEQPAIVGVGRGFLQQVSK